MFGPGVPELDLLDADASPVSVYVDNRDLAQIIYTSGTESLPKGAMLTVGNHWWSAVGSALNLGLRPDDRWLACLPLFHVGGQAIVLRAAIYGITAVVHDGFDPRGGITTIDWHWCRSTVRRAARPKRATT